MRIATYTTPRSTSPARRRLVLAAVAALAIGLATSAGVPSASARAVQHAANSASSERAKPVLLAEIGPIPDPHPSPDVNLQRAVQSADGSGNGVDPQNNVGTPVATQTGTGSGGSWIIYVLVGLAVVIGVGAWLGRSKT